MIFSSMSEIVDFEGHQNWLTPNAFVLAVNCVGLKKEQKIKLGEEESCQF